MMLVPPDFLNVYMPAGKCSPTPIRSVSGAVVAELQSLTATPSVGSSTIPIG